MSLGLTQHDVEELKEHVGGVFTQSEIESLYTRFKTLDRSRKGFITTGELLSIPELSINPLAQRLVRLFESVHFKEFVRVLAAFSRKATKAQKIEFIFHVYDVDGDGIVAREDMLIMLRQLAGSTLSDEDLNSVVDQVFKAAGKPGGLDLSAFREALKDADLSGMAVDIPCNW